MTHRRRPYEQSRDSDQMYDVRSYDDRAEDSGEDNTRTDRRRQNDRNNEENSEDSDKRGNRGENWKDRTDGWNNRDKRDTWGGRQGKGGWGDKRSGSDKRRSEEEWNNRNRDSWNDRSRRRDDPWEDRDRKDRQGDDVDDGDRRGRDRSRRDRDRSRDRERSRSYRRSSSFSPDRDGNQTSLAGEWICKCGALNFKRRVSCFRTRCGASRSEAVSMVTNDNKTVHVQQQNVSIAAMISTQQYTVEDIPALAAYSAEMYAGNKIEHSTYLKYYTDYYTQQLAQRIMGVTKSETDKVNVAAAVAQSAISQVQAKATPVKTPPNGIDNRVYPIPDISTYLYDQTSGYYYDPTTGLYYDSNTQYYFNNQINQYLYWDNTKYTYILASTLQNAAQITAPPMAAPTVVTTSVTESPQIDDKKNKTGDKTDKVKVAKKIAKDMERWAKAMNQKKEAAKVGSEPLGNSGTSSSKSADIGFSVLEQRVPVNNNSNTNIQVPVTQPPMLVPSYGGGSDSSGDESESFTDWEKLACLLCKRQFPSREVLEKHQQMSELHKQNLEILKGKHDCDERPSKSNREPSGYRDRAAERRMKYGEDDAPIVRNVRPDPIIPSVPQAIGEENIGNRLLKKMGWTAGQGLGKEGQGILGPVEATTTGLGRKKGIYTAGPGETYRGCVKKLTMARYQDLIGSEGNS